VFGKATLPGSEDRTFESFLPRRPESEPRAGFRIQKCRRGTYTGLM